MTAAVEFQVARSGSGNWGRRLDERGLTTFLKDHISKPNEVRLLEVPGNHPGPVLSRLAAIERGVAKCARANPGYKLLFLAERDKVDWIVRVVRDDTPTDTTGTNAIDAIWSATYDKWDSTYNVIDLGICASKPGQHLRCNAWDGGVGKPDSADDIHQAILKVANWLRTKMLADMGNEPGGLPILGIIVMEQWCSRESTNWSPYHGIAHVTHWHVSGYPSKYPGWI